MSWIRRRITFPLALADFIEEQLLLEEIADFSWERLPGMPTTELSIYAEKADDLPAPERIETWLGNAAAAGLPRLALAYQDEDMEPLDWSEGFRDHFAARRLGDRIVIIPSWERSDLRRAGHHVEPGDEMELVIEPGRAFGAGDHPTTRACLLRLEAWFADGGGRGTSCLDIGSGTGVLGIAARLWGAERVVGYDIDHESIVNSYLNADLNGLAGRITFLWGEARELEPEAWDLILCNLFLGPILRLIPRMDGALRPGGRLILSGFLSSQAGEIRAAGKARGWSLATEDLSDDWVIQVWSKPA